MQNGKIRTVKFNAAMNFILSASSFIFPLITMPYITRVLQADAFGKVNYAATFLTYFVMFSSLGIPTYGIRACAQVRDDREKLSRTVQELLIINAVTTAVTYLVFFITVYSVEFLRAESTLLIINSASLFLNVIGVQWLYSALEQYSYITVRSLVFKAVSVALMFVLVHRQSDYIVYAAITVLASGGSNVLNFIRLRKFVALKPVGHYDFKRHIKPLIFFLASAVATSIYTGIDTLMLTAMTGYADNGYFQAATKVKTILVTFVTSLGAVLLPRLSYYAGEKRMREFNSLIVKSFNFVLVVASALSVYFILFAKETIMILSGKGFLSAIPAMQILMPTLLFIGLSYITGLQILTPLMKENVMLYSYIAGSCVDLVLNLILIPALHATGTAIATTVTEFVVLLIQCLYLSHILSAIVRQLSLKKTGAALAVSAAAAYLLKAGLRLPDFAMMVVSALLFFGLYFVLLVLMKEPFVLETILPLLKKAAGRITPRIKFNI